MKIQVEISWVGQSTSDDDGDNHYHYDDDDKGDVDANQANSQSPYSHHLHSTPLWQNMQRQLAKFCLRKNLKAVKNQPPSRQAVLIESK